MENTELQEWLGQVAAQMVQQLKTEGLQCPAWVTLYDDSPGRRGLIVGFELDSKGRACGWNWRVTDAIEDVCLRVVIADAQGVARRGVIRERTWNLEAA